MIYVFFADGFEEIEGLAAVDILRRAELEVQTVGVGGKVVTALHGVPVTCDITDAEARREGLEMIVLPGGGPGTRNLEASPVVQGYLDYAVENGLWVAAICAAPTILGNKGLLKGKRATCYPTLSAKLEGAAFTGERVEQDGRIITGKGPGASIPFALRLVEALLGKEKADAVQAALQ